MVRYDFSYYDGNLKIKKIILKEQFARYVW